MCAVPAPYPQKFREDVVRAARAREDGVTRAQIAKDFGVHERTLLKWVCQADVDDGNRPSKAVSDDQCTLLIGDEMGHRVIPPGMRLEVSRMMRSGVSFSEIGRRAGLHWGTVADWARAEGFAGVRGRNGGATLARRPAELESTMKPSGPGRRLGIEERSLIQWWVSQGWTNS